MIEKEDFKEKYLNEKLVRIKFEMDALRTRYSVLENEMKETSISLKEHRDSKDLKNKKSGDEVSENDK